MCTTHDARRTTHERRRARAAHTRMKGQHLLRLYLQRTCSRVTGVVAHGLVLNACQHRGPYVQTCTWQSTGSKRPIEEGLSRSPQTRRKPTTCWAKAPTTNKGGRRVRGGSAAVPWPPTGNLRSTEKGLRQAQRVAFHGLQATNTRVFQPPYLQRQPSNT